MVKGERKREEERVRRERKYQGTGRVFLIICAAPCGVVNVRRLMFC
jgi:hypothetical protein